MNMEYNCTYAHLTNCLISVNLCVGRHLTGAFVLSLKQNSDVKTDGQRSKVSPIRRIIAFSIHNSIAKPTVAPVTSAKVTPRVDGIESRKPYGHWVPIRQGGRAHKRTTSR